MKTNQKEEEQERREQKSGQWEERIFEIMEISVYK